MSANVKVVQP